MEQIKELQLPEQIENEIEYKVKEIKKSITLINSTRVVETTDLINGTLKVFLMKCNKQCSVKISLADYPQIILYNDRTLNGGYFYVPVRAYAYSEKGEIRNYQSSEYCLNDRLLIEVEGVEGSQFDLVVRYY